MSFVFHRVVEAGHDSLLVYPLIRLDANEPAYFFVPALLGEHAL
jgi:hypothetical protein